MITIEEIKYRGRPKEESESTCEYIARIESLPFLKQLFDAEQYEKTCAVRRALSKVRKLKEEGKLEKEIENMWVDRGTHYECVINRDKDCLEE